jgi:hypothetical protein
MLYVREITLVMLMIFCEFLFKDIDDVDKENMQDPVQVALYAWDIFKYYKEREVI